VPKRLFPLKSSVIGSINRTTIILSPDESVAAGAFVIWQWQTRSSPSQVNCWSRSAKWPDGQPFTVFDVFEQANTSANVELNKKRHAESIVTRNQWVVSTRQKLIACETGAAALFDEQRRDQPEKCASWSLASAPDNPDWRLGRTRVSLAQSVGLL